jgi:preprotein translocase subunit YajC
VIRKGTKVERLTKKVGQIPATGTVLSVRDDHFFEIEWDDGHTSIVTKDGVARVTEANRPHKGG